jgi:diaminopimelate decarboxylase
MPALVRPWSGLMDGLDVASAGEMKVALDAGCDPRVMSFAGPGKRKELGRPWRPGARSTSSRKRELPHIRSGSSGLGVRPRVAVRVNPDFELKSSGMKMARRSEAVRHRRRAGAAGAPEIGSRRFRVRWLSSVQRFAEPAGGSPLRCPAQDARPRRPAGGRTRRGRFRSSTWAEDSVSRTSPAMCRSTSLRSPRICASSPNEARTTLPGATLVIELGRYLVAHSGLYVAKVLDRKVSRGQVFLVTDGGLHHHFAASGNFGQVIRKNYPVVVGTRMDATDVESSSIVGPLCTPLDLLGDRMELPRAEPGDLVCVLMSGAYGYTSSPHLFLSHPAPVEVLV